MTEAVKTKVVYQWQTPRGAVAMEFLTEDAARKWHAARSDMPNAAHMASLELFKVETTNITTKL